MKDTFRIGNGNLTSTNQVTPVYLNYASDLGITLTEEIFNRDVQTFGIFYESPDIKPIIFKPKTAKLQTTSKYYFIKLDIKIPRNT